MKIISILILLLFSLEMDCLILRAYKRGGKAGKRMASQSERDQSILRFLDDKKAHDDFKIGSDSDLKPKSNSNKQVDKFSGGTIRVHKPKNTKPLFIDMSPIYDYRNY